MTDQFRTKFLGAFSCALGISYDQWVEEFYIAERAFFSAKWVCLIGYDPQRLLPPPPCVNHPDRWSWIMLDLENLCRQCANDWLRGERDAAENGPE